MWAGHSGHLALRLPLDQQAPEGKGCGPLQPELPPVNPSLACLRLQAACLQAAVWLKPKMRPGFCFFELSKSGNPLPLPWLQGKRETKIFISVCCCISLAFKAEMLFMLCQQWYFGQSGYEFDAFDVQKEKEKKRKRRKNEREKREKREKKKKIQRKEEKKREK